MAEIWYVEYEGERLSCQQLRSEQGVIKQPLQNKEEEQSSSVAEARSLSEYEETLVFVKVWLRLRLLFTGRNHEAAFARMHEDLSKLGIVWDVPTLTRKRRNLLDQFKKREKGGKLSEWELAKPLAVIQNLATEDTLKNTDFCEMSQDTFSSDVAMFTKGAVWTHVATKALICICTENVDTYNSDTVRHTSFFNEVSQLLKEKSHFYDGAQCERKMAALKKEYRDEVRRQGQTGAPGLPQFPYFEDMAVLMSNDASVYPRITVAAGVVSRQVTSAGQRDAEQPSTSSGNRGLTRPPTLKRPKALAERKVKAIENIAEAMQKKYSP